MKNLIPYNEDCFNIHKRAVDRKHKSDLKSRLELLNETIQTDYNTFLKRFNENKLYKLTPNTNLKNSKNDLLTLYDYQSSVIISVRESIKKLQTQTIVSTCQNCTIDSANTLDHLLPKSKFPEFVVNPKNLIPCCSTCNSYKLNSINDDGKDLFLNLYLDKLPEEQYLFTDITLDKYNEIHFQFYLKNIDNKINTDFFDILKNHYRKLCLYERMRLKSIEYISELENLILGFKENLPLDEIINILRNNAQINKKAYGQNHWKYILEETLLNSPLFTDKFK